jgi:hypothetical protein
MGKLRAIFDPLRATHYETSAEYQGTDEYLVISNGHRPMQLSNADVIPRRYNSNNPNSIDRAADKATKFDADLVRFLKSQDDLDADQVNLFELRKTEQQTEGENDAEDNADAESESDVKPKENKKNCPVSQTGQGQGRQEKPQPAAAPLVKRRGRPKKPNNT